MSWKNAWILVLTLSAFVTIAAAEIQLTSTNIPPKIDGVLDDTCWKGATAVPINHIIGSSETLDKHMAYVFRDASYLYVGYDIKHPARDRVPCNYVKGLDDFVQRDDCVKLSFDPGTDGKQWYHFKVNRANVRQDRRIVDGRMEIQEFNIPWRSATQENDDNWTAEIAIPLCLLYPFDHPEKAKINLLTTTYTQGRDPMGVASGEPKRTLFTATSLAAGFDETNKFIPLKDLDFLTVKAPFLPSVEKAAVTEYFKKDGQYHYGIDLVLKTCSASAGKVNLRLTDKTADGQEKTIEEMIDIPVNAVKKSYCPAIPVDSLIKRTASLKMIAPESGEVLQEIRFREEDMKSLDLMSAYASRNYYASEPDAVAVCDIRLPEEELKTMTLSAVNAKGESLAELPAPTSKTELKVPLGKLTMNEVNSISIRLSDRQNRQVSSMSVDFIRRAPKPGREWQIDQTRRVVLNNGSPFFGMGLVTGRLTGNNSEEDLARIAAAGFTFIMRWERLESQEEWARFLTLAEKHGLYVMSAIDDSAAARKTPLVSFEKYFKGKELERLRALSPWGYTGVKCELVMDAALKALSKSAKNEIFQEFCDKNAPFVKTAIETAMNSKALMGYWIFDEPAIPLIDQGNMGRDMYNLINKTDGYHPVGVNYSSEIPNTPAATDWFDILMTDPYWSPAEKYRGSPDYVSKITAYTDFRATPRRQPCWIVPVAPEWGGTRKRIPTGAEQACQTYLAAINGATGIMYFTYDNIHDQGTWNAVSEMARQFKVLGPMFTAQKPEHKTAYFVGEKEISADPMNGKIPDIQFVLLRSPEGGFTMVAANCRYYPVKATIKIAGLSGMVGRYFADNTYTVVAGAFADEFEPFGVRAYKLPSLTATPPFDIIVKLTPPEKIPPPERAAENACRQDKKNFFPNPSFEETSVPGWPDYYRNPFSGWRIGPMIGEKGAVWGIDNTIAKFGKNSMRIGRRVWWRCAPQFREDTPCVFSVWLKGSQDGLKVSMICGAFTGVKTKAFTVTDQWRRYEFPGIFKSFAGEHNMFDIRLLDDGTLWIDGLQLEKGAKATEFEE